MKIEAADHWYVELGKLRCWLAGYQAGRGSKLDAIMGVPGQEVLWQIQGAIKDVKKGKKTSA